MANSFITLDIGASVTIPTSTQKVIFADTDGTLKSLDSTGTEASLAGTIDAGTRSTTVATGDSLAATGLNSDSDGGYRVYFKLATTGSDKVYVLEFNGGAITAFAGGTAPETASTWTVVAGALKTVCYLGVAGGGGREVLYGNIEILGKTGERRQVVVSTIGCAVDGTPQNAVRSTFTFTGTGNITDLRLIPSDHTTGLVAAGSFVVVQKLGMTA